MWRRPSPSPTSSAHTKPSRAARRWATSSCAPHKGILCMSRAQAAAAAVDYFDSGRFQTDLARRIAIETESQEGRGETARAYLEQEIGPALATIGFRWRCIENSAAAACPFLVAERWESDELPTVLT